jgi:hypothetical protein
MRGFFSLLLVFLSACSILGKNPTPNQESTPAGWHIAWQDQGTLSSNRHTKEELYSLFDGAMVRACNEMQAQHPPYTATGVMDSLKARQKNYNTVFTLVDHFQFPISAGSVDFPSATSATGLNDLRGNITVTFWNSIGKDNGVATEALIPAGAPPWTHYHSSVTGRWYWGVETPGGQYPALGYEIGHNFGF